VKGPRPGRPEAAAAVWDWATGPDARSAGPSTASGRLRGSIQALAGIAIGAALFAFVSKPAGTLVVAIASLVGIAALASPRHLFARIERAFAALGDLLGRAVAALLLPVIFFGVFLPFGLLFRRGHRDSMRRFFDADSETYWSAHTRGGRASRAPGRQY
jgi:hypothetical protein